MKRISLPVLFIKPEDQRAIELGIKTDTEVEPEIRKVTFYSIEAVSPYYRNSELMSNIHTASQNFICPMNPEVVNGLIED